MLSSSKKKKLQQALKDYNKKYLSNKFEDLDESGTRIMVNTFLTNVLGFTSIEEIKTEYMIRGTYADYVVQTKGERHFLVEVKAFSLNLSDKHLRQAINYGANEGIELALLTNGKQYNLYKILFNKPIESKLIFSIDLCDAAQLKDIAETVQYLHKDSVDRKGLQTLWSKCVALEPGYVAGLLYTRPVMNFIRRELKRKFKHKFDEAEIENAINRVVSETVDMDSIRYAKAPKQKKKKQDVAGSVQEVVISSHNNDQQHEAQQEQKTSHE